MGATTTWALLDTRCRRCLGVRVVDEDEAAAVGCDGVDGDAEVGFEAPEDALLGSAETDGDDVARDRGVGAEAPRAAGAVRVVRGRGGQVEVVDDVRHRGRVDAARGDLGRDEDERVAAARRRRGMRPASPRLGAEPAKRVGAVLAVVGAGERERVEAVVVAEFGGELGRRLGIGGEHDGRVARRVRRAQDFAERVEGRRRRRGRHARVDHGTRRERGVRLLLLLLLLGSSSF
mmetsp:Transcript_25669/g.102397  ORF Transcript_25669/g.102397 Transcript_25669/m.102397 type:complete len:233 (-) Transcript_25669:1096-1794(-)